MQFLFRSLSIGIICLSLIAPCALAGGSISTAEVLPLLQQNPALCKFILDHLDLDSGGWAIRIGSRVNYALGGTRIAPYSIRARPKGSKEPWQFYLKIDAKTYYYDASGKEVQLEDGKSIKEKLTGIELLPIPDA